MARLAVERIVGADRRGAGSKAMRSSSSQSSGFEPARDRTRTNVLTNIASLLYGHATNC